MKNKSAGVTHEEIEKMFSEFYKFSNRHSTGQTLDHFKTWVLSEYVSESPQSEPEDKIQQAAELKSFLDEVRHQRTQFIKEASKDWWIDIGVERVVFEDILIMYDQMHERLRQFLETLK